MKLKSLAMGMVLPLTASIALSTAPAASAAPAPSFQQVVQTHDNWGNRHDCSWPRWDRWDRWHRWDRWRDHRCDWHRGGHNWDGGGGGNWGGGGGGGGRTW